jgi:2,3-bisphosphoglycerate-independent phosphoglycerate mutase
MMNFANPDMVAHTGNLPATIKGVQVTDWAIGEVVKETLKHDGMVFMTADHGNAEELISFPTDNFFFTSAQGVVNTDHSNNPVPLLVIANKYRGKVIELPKGVMSDLAPTMLKEMGLPVPPEMNGQDLLANVR